VVIGEPFRDVVGTSSEGMVYIYNVTDGSMYNITSSIPQDDAWFGASLDVDGEIVVIGEQSRDVVRTSNEGMVYIYNVTDKSMYNITSPIPQEGARFGIYVAVDGEIVVIGESQRDVVGTSNEGMVYIYNLTDKSIYNFTSPIPQEEAEFGLPVAVNGETVAIGEGNRTVGGTMGAGMVYIYNLTDKSIYNFTSPIPQEEAEFGLPVAVDGEIVAIGETRRDVVGTSNEGMAYIYNLTDKSMYNITSPIPQADAGFGIFVAVDGEIVVIGEMWRDIFGTSEEGMAYIYNLTDKSMYNITSPIPQDSAWFGAPVAVDGDLVVIGEYYRDIFFNSNEGAAYVYRLNGLEPPPEPSEVLPSEPVGGEILNYQTSISLLPLIALSLIVILIVRKAHTGNILIKK
jgi:hypothetical protein